MTDRTEELRAAAIRFAVAYGKESWRVNGWYNGYDRIAERKNYECLCAVRAAFERPSAPLHFGMYGEFEGEALESLRECVRLSKAHSVYVAGFYIEGDAERGIELSESFRGFLGGLRGAMDTAYFRTSRHSEHTDPGERAEEEHWLIKVCGYNPFAKGEKSA